MTITTFEPDTQELTAAGPVPDWVSLLAPAVKLAEVLAQTEFVPRSMRNSPPAIAACILYGHELGISPMQSLASISVVEGKPSPSAELLRALIYAAGHELWVEEATGTRVTVAGRRKSSSDVVKVAWTMDMAKAAGLAGKQNWRSYPRQMLMARATSELARVLFPDVIRGLGEIPDDEALEGEAAPPALSAVAAPAGDGTTPMRRQTRKRTAPAVEAPEAPPVIGPSAPESGAEEPPDTSADQIEPETQPAVQQESTPVEEPAAPAVDGITDAQLQKLNIQLREQVGGLREAKLQLLSELLGRPITSSKELTISDASHAIEALQRISEGIDPMPGSGAG